MKVLRYFETLLTSRPTTNSRITEFTDLQQRRCEHLKSRYTPQVWPRPFRPAFETLDRLPIVNRWTHKHTWWPRFADPKTFTWSCYTTYFRSPLNMRWNRNSNLSFACRPSWCDDVMHNTPTSNMASPGEVTPKLMSISDSQSVDRGFQEIRDHFPGDSWIQFRNGYFEVHLTLNEGYNAF